MAPPLLLFLLLLLPALAAGHQHPSSYGSSALSEWRPAKASYYAADPEDAIGTLPDLPVSFIVHPHQPQFCQPSSGIFNSSYQCCKPA
jgi:hypothetical protein